MNHKHINHLLTDFIDGSLDAATTERVKSHLIFCKDCRKHLTDLETNIAALKSRPTPTVPEGLEDRIVRAVNTELNAAPEKNDQPNGSFWAKWAFSYRGFALAATCALVLIVVAQWPDRPETPISPGSFQKSTRSHDRGPAPQRRVREADRRDARQSEPNLGMENLENRVDADRLSKESEALAGMEKPSISAPEPKTELAPAVMGRKAAPAEKQVLEEKGIAGAGSPQAFTDSLGQTQSTGSDESAVPAPFTGTSGFSSGYTEPIEMVISSPRLWRSVWKKHHQSMTSAPPLPQIDFRNQEIIFISGGNQPTGGYSIEINEIENTTWEGNPARVVNYRILSPDPSAIKIMSITQPFLIKPVPRVQGPTFFRKNR